MCVCVWGGGSGDINKDVYTLFTTRLFPTTFGSLLLAVWISASNKATSNRLMHGSLGFMVNNHPTAMAEPEDKRGYYKP